MKNKLVTSPFSVGVCIVFSLCPPFHVPYLSLHQAFPYPGGLSPAVPRGGVRAHLVETMPQGFGGEAKVARLSASERLKAAGRTAWGLGSVQVWITAGSDPPSPLGLEAHNLPDSSQSVELKLANVSLGRQAIHNLSGSQHLP